MSGSPSGLAPGFWFTREPTGKVLEAVYALRVDAWSSREPRFSRALLKWTDAFDASAQHFVVMHDQQPVAAARVTIHGAIADCPDASILREIDFGALSPPLAYFGRMVVGKSHASQGLAQFLDCRRLDFAIASGCGSAVVATPSGRHRLTQLEAIGFSQAGLAQGPSSGPLTKVAPPTVLVMTLP